MAIFMHMKHQITFFACLLAISACVSTKKFDELAFQKRKLENEKMDLSKTLANQEATIVDLRAKEARLAEVEMELSKRRTEVANLRKSHADLMTKYDELLAQNQAELEISSEEKAMLSKELAAKQTALDQKERELQFLERKLQSQEENLVALQEDVVIRERRLAELTRKLYAKDSLMQSIRSSINEALRGFSAEDLTVSERNGKVYVSLSQNLLFAKGSDVLDAAGKDAIRKVANVLKEHPDIEINVEGHTDSDGTSDKNWDLSVMRATTVVKQLTSSGLDPHQVIASGRGLYFPKVENNTEENKSINRRTEIILSPDLNTLYSLLE